MASFKTAHLAILFQLMLAKAGKTPMLKDFREVSNKIGEYLKLNDTDISPEYLRKQHNQIVRALQEGKEEIGLKPGHMDLCCKYIDFESYQEYKEHCDKIMGHINVEELRADKVHLFYYEKDQEYILQKLNQCFYPGQERKVEPQVYEKGLSGLFQEFSRLQKEDRLIIWCLPQLDEDTDTESQLQQFLKGQALKNLVPLLPEDEGENPYLLTDPLYEANSFCLVVALANHVVQHLAGQQSNPKSAGKETVHVHNANQVVLGDMHIKGEYISQKDMYITINKTND